MRQLPSSYAGFSRSGGSFNSRMPEMGSVRRIRPPAWRGCARLAARPEMPTPTGEAGPATRRRFEPRGGGSSASNTAGSGVGRGGDVVRIVYAVPGRVSRRLTVETYPVAGGTSYYAREDGELGGRVATNSHAGALVKDEALALTKPTVRGGTAGRAQSRFSSPLAAGGAKSVASAVADLSIWEH